MDSEKINSMLRAMGHEFDTFANALSEGAITELAPPFSDYVSFDGNLIDYYQQFFQNTIKNYPQVYNFKYFLWIEMKKNRVRDLTA